MKMTDDEKRMAAIAAGWMESSRGEICKLHPADPEHSIVVNRWGDAIGLDVLVNNFLDLHIIPSDTNANVMHVIDTSGAKIATFGGAGCGHGKTPEAIRQQARNFLLFGRIPLKLGIKHGDTVGSTHDLPAGKTLAKLITTPVRQRCDAMSESPLEVSVETLEEYAGTTWHGMGDDKTRAQWATGYFKEHGAAVHTDASAEIAVDMDSISSIHREFARKCWPPTREARTLDEGKALADLVLADLGIEAPDLSWRLSENSISPWAFKDLDVGSWRPLTIGASAGGVISVNGHPFAPDGVVNVTYDCVHQSIQAALLKPEPRPASHSTGSPSIGV